jgi:hypothetical protein
MEANLVADRGWKPTTSMTRDGRAVLVLDFQEVRITRERETREITDKDVQVKVYMYISVCLPPYRRRCEALAPPPPSECCLSVKTFFFYTVKTLFGVAN